ncbi:sigma-70 family RNA polymerase sigma factor [Singulisphaera acidiphila]|uniref:RNA polymerase sigma factor, sigma-70 family n=1 Tax=Singulisphaera acidiphila (strain ATCC BAA-1392 / DSM 18658 / VKM B-2454 / MOB10) TaxID=886293 RepID=L0DFX9_SINAD|nr:sigma-70 family RNA polymerase sigma factor [Singulisphaera acidiphila]AGA28167.1 RNA polymerase sigma factor, sigma-70 family [Singulisphaera acidiphila DSM 18658]
MDNEKRHEIKVMVDVTVESLIEDARGGAQKSLGDALEALRPYLVRIAMNELAPDLRPKGDVSDLVQETFLEAARDFGNFTGRTGPEWRSWLRRIFFNNLNLLARTYRNTIKRDVGVEVSLDQVKAAGVNDHNLVLSGSSPSSVVMKKEMGEVIQDALTQLTDRERQLLIMRFREQCTFEEMGRRLGYSPVAARKALRKAVARVREQVDFSSMAG